LILVGSRLEKGPKTMTTITILGAGFGAVAAARALRGKLPDARIALVAKAPEFVYLPSLIWLPNRLRQGKDLRIDLAPFLERHRLDFHAGEAMGLADGGRLVRTTAGEIRNDALVIATGGRFMKKLPGIEKAILPCEGIAAAEKLRDRLEDLKEGNLAFGFAGNPNEPTAMRGGPIFEFILGTDRLLRRRGLRDKFKITFFSPAKEPGNRLGPKAFPRLQATFVRRGIDLHLGHKLKAFEDGKVVTEGGEVPADLIVFMPGLTGPAWIEGTDLPRSPGGLIQADGLCRVPGFERTYVIGDAGSHPGPDWMPKQAHMADLQAGAVAANLADDLAGREPTTSFRVELACIIDEGNAGALAMRRPGFDLMLPSAPVWHWAKRGFEWWYLRRFR
jgi:sulfide:quinone oxidoreductase